MARPADELVRITCGADGTLHIGGPSDGRGVWVGPSQRCLGAAVPRLRRGLRADIEADAIAALVAAMEQLAVARGGVAEPPPGCIRANGNPRRGQ